MDGRTLSVTDTKQDGAWTNMADKAPPVAGLRLLYHGNIARIGSITDVDTFKDNGWVALGRLGPIFVSPDGTKAPLSDPYISRGQAAVRWNGLRSCFEIKPSESARRTMSVVELRRGQPEAKMTPINGAMRLPPGTLVSVGDRALMMLEFGPRFGPERDRLGMVGETPEIWELRRAIEDVSGFSRPTLVLGETGVGKELVSHALHDTSDRAEGPFVAANCAALPENLVESILFGHKKGAFTGATTDSSGMFLDAHDGSLFLDEIGELPMVLQAKLLRVLQDQKVMPVGGRKELSSNARVIAATNRHPNAEIQQGRLRDDLYYRLSAHVIKIPTLRDRYLDVPALFAHFVGECIDEQPRLSWLCADPPPAHLPIPMDFFLTLLRHSWPGNVRELQNIAEQTARLNLRPGTFQAPTLIRPPAAHPQPDQTHVSSDAVLSATPEPSQTMPTDSFMLQASKRLRLKRKTFERLLSPETVPLLPELDDPNFVPALSAQLSSNLFALMERKDFNQTQVAQALGVARGTLIRLMKQFDLPRATDLSVEQITLASQEAEGNLEGMSQRLRVSPHSLKGRLTQEGLDHLVSD
ncbi:MAG: sigma-54 dependent transcriptional regulator [Myxococcota bacterium]